MEERAEVQLRTEQLLIAIVRGKMPETSVVLELLADVSERLATFDPERK